MLVSCSHRYVPLWRRQNKTQSRVLICGKEELQRTYAFLSDVPDVSDVDDLPVVVDGGNGDRILANLRGHVFVYFDAQDLEHVESCRDAEKRRVCVEKQERTAVLQE